jgi:hypothetical protein
MPALVAGIHAATMQASFEARPKRSAVPSIRAALPGVDGRDKPGHDEAAAFRDHRAYRD